MGKVPHPTWGWGYRQNLNGIGSAWYDGGSWGISGRGWWGPAIRDSDVVSPSRMTAQADVSSFGMYLGGKPDGGPSFGGRSLMELHAGLTFSGAWMLSLGGMLSL